MCLHKHLCSVLVFPQRFSQQPLSVSFCVFFPSPSQMVASFVIGTGSSGTSCLFPLPVSAMAVGELLVHPVVQRKEIFDDDLRVVLLGPSVRRFLNAFTTMYRERLRVRCHLTFSFLAGVRLWCRNPDSPSLRTFRFVFSSMVGFDSIGCAQGPLTSHVFLNLVEDDTFVLCRMVIFFTPVPVPSFQVQGSGTPRSTR
eukprot:RCo054037